MSGSLRPLSALLFALSLLLAITTTMALGCSEGQSATNVSQVVHPDSPEARRALAETEKMLKEREAAEAKAHRRRPKLPNPEPGS